MKSIRLNKTIRETIVNNIRAAWIEANPAPVNPQDPADILYKAAEQCHLQDPKVKAALKFAKTEAGKAVVAMSTSLSFRLPDGEYTYMYAVTSPETGEVLVNNARNFANNHKDTKHLKKYVSAFGSVTCDFHNEDFLKDNPTAAQAVKEFNKARKENHKLRKAHSEWELKRDNYMEQVTQVVGGVNTTGQLIEQWEEVAQFIPEGYRNPSRIQLPAVSVASLNAGLAK